MSNQRKCSRCLELIKRGEPTVHNSGNNSVTHRTPCRMRRIEEMSEEELEDMSAEEAFRRGAEFWGGGSEPCPY